MGLSLRGYARSHRFATWLTLIAVAGLVLRIVVAIVLRDRAIAGDGYRYHFGAHLLADGRGFLNPLGEALGREPVPDTGHPPLWTIVLAVPTKLGLRTYLQHGLLASLIGTGTIVMTGLAGCAAFGKRVGLIAAALAALYPFLWVYEHEVLSEPIVMLFIATMIWLAYRFIAAPSLGKAIGLGVVLGLLAMTKADQLALSVLLVVPLILSRRTVELRRRIEWLAMAAVVCLVIVAPWSIYLSLRFDRPVLLNGSAGDAMLAGNNVTTYSGEKLGYYDDQLQYLALVRVSDDPIVFDARAERKVAIEFIKDHSDRFPIVSAARVGRMFGLFRPFQQMHFETERGSPLWVFRSGFVVYWLLLPFAIAGVVIARRRKVPVYPLLVFPLLSLLAVLLTIGNVRYRAPAEVPLVLLAAVAIDAVLKAWRRRDVAKRPITTTDLEAQPEPAIVERRALGPAVA